MSMVYVEEHWLMFYTPLPPKSGRLPPLEFNSSSLQAIFFLEMLLESWNFKTEFQTFIFSYGYGSSHLPISVQIYKIITSTLQYRSNSSYVGNYNRCFISLYVATGIKNSTKFNLNSELNFAVYFYIYTSRW